MMEYRARILHKHMGVAYGEMAQQFGITRKELNRWFRDKTLIPEDQYTVISEYFGLKEEELFEEVTLDITYKFLSELVNKINRPIKEHTSNPDYEVEDLIQELQSVQEEVKNLLIEEQRHLKII